MWKWSYCKSWELFEHCNREQSGWLTEIVSRNMHTHTLEELVGAATFSNCEPLFWDERLLCEKKKEREIMHFHAAGVYLGREREREMKAGTSAWVQADEYGLNQTLLSVSRGPAAVIPLAALDSYAELHNPSVIPCGNLGWTSGGIISLQYSVLCQMLMLS